MELGPLQTRWLEALESGKYKQGTGCLRRDDKFCCLGVACEVAGKPAISEHNGGLFSYGGHVNAMPPDVVNMYGIGEYANDIYQDLMFMNDEGKSFKEIAEYIREHKDKLFSESK